MILQSNDKYKIQVEDSNDLYEVGKESDAVAVAGTYTGFADKTLYSSAIQRKLQAEFLPLKNLGNSSCLSAILQLLLHTPLLSTYILTNTYKRSINLNVKDDLLLEALGDVSRAYARNENLEGELRRFSVAADRLLESSVNAMQCDAQELFDAILARLNKELSLNALKDSCANLSAIKYKEEKTNATYKDVLRHKKDCEIIDGQRMSAIDSLFSGRIERIITCTACGSTSNRHEDFYHLSLPVPEAVLFSNKFVRAIL